MVISAVVLNMHSIVAHIEDDRLWSEECDRMLLEGVGGRPTLRDEVTACVNAAALHQLRSLNSMIASADGSRWWVKSRCITWFDQFALTEYDDYRWIELFRMSKATLLRISEHVHPIIGKQDTNFRGCVPTRIRVAAALFKIAHNAHHVIVTELFRIGRATVGTVLREVVGAINIVFGDLICWLEDEDM
jgi:hypothetical protein